MVRHKGKEREEERSREIGTERDAHTRRILGPEKLFQSRVFVTLLIFSQCCFREVNNSG